MASAVQASLGVEVSKTLLVLAYCNHKAGADGNHRGRAVQ